MNLTNFSLHRALFSLVPVLLAGGLSAQAPSSNAPIAVIGEEKLFDADLAPSLLPQLQHIRKQEFEAKKSALEMLIGEKLLEREAKSRGVSVQELLRSEVEARVPEPTAGEAEVLYISQQNAQMPPMETILPQLKQRIRQLRLQAAHANFRKQLWSKYKAAVLMRPAALEVSFDPARLRGNPKSPVRIVEFTDFQCPYCSRVQSVLADVRKKYGDKVSVAVRDFPLRQIHPAAQQAAVASRCAGDQQKYWEYHDQLFANNSSLDEVSLVKYASVLSLDEAKFKACLASGRYDSAIENDFQDGRRLGVNGTPSFFVNGIPVVGTQGIAEFEKVIDAELAAIANGAR